MRIAGIGSLALFILATGAVAADADTEAARKFIAALKLGDTLQHGDVTVVPIQLVGEPADPRVTIEARDPKLTYAEPGSSGGRYDLVVKNGSDGTVFLSGGTVVVGGKMDRLIARDHLIAPGAELKIRALAAASPSDVRSEPIAFEESPVFAPLYVRAEADSGGSASVVPTFIARWSDFLNEGDDRKSLAAFVDSKKLREYALGTKAELDALPAALAKPQIVGGVSALHGRVQALTAYANNDMVAACFPPTVKGATYAAAALAIRATESKLPLPGLGEPEKRKALVRDAAEKLLERLQKATFSEQKLGEGETGSSLRIHMTDGTKGRVTVVNGVVVHLVLYPRDPFRQKLYGSAMDAPDEKADPEKQAPPDAEPEDPVPPGGGGDVSDDEWRFLELHRVLRPGRGGERRGGGGGRR